MSETEGQEEPTMEEILASIRKIISEDDVEEGKTAEAPEVVAEAEPEPVSEAEPEAEPELEIEPEPEEEPEEEQVLELTEMVEDEIEAEPEPAAAEPEIDLGSDLGIDDVDPATGEDELMSEDASNFTMDQFGVLSDLLTSGYQGSGNTLEDLVREMLKPMLKVWLDKNLPPIVERMIAKEIARLARTKKP